MVNLGAVPLVHEPEIIPIAVPVTVANVSLVVFLQASYLAGLLAPG